MIESLQSFLPYMTPQPIKNEILGSSHSVVQWARARAYGVTRMSTTLYIYVPKILTRNQADLKEGHTINEYNNKWYN